MDPDQEDELEKNIKLSIYEDQLMIISRNISSWIRRQAFMTIFHMRSHFWIGYKLNLRLIENLVCGSQALSDEFGDLIG